MFKAEALGKNNGTAPAKTENPDAYANEYKEACSYLGEEILPADVLQRALTYIGKNWKELRAEYPEGTKCCLAVIPTSEMGFALNDAEVKNRAYLKLLHVSHIDGLTYDFAFKGGHYFELLPQYMQDNCTFTVHYEEPANALPGADTKKFKEGYTGAFNNLRNFFGLPPLAK